MVIGLYKMEDEEVHWFIGDRAGLRNKFPTYKHIFYGWVIIKWLGYCISNFCNQQYCGFVKSGQAQLSTSILLRSLANIYECVVTEVINTLHISISSVEF